LEGLANSLPEGGDFQYYEILQLESKTLAGLRHRRGSGIFAARPKEPTVKILEYKDMKPFIVSESDEHSLADLRVFLVP
jgi:hypothetical protein